MPLFNPSSPTSNGIGTIIVADAAARAAAVPERKGQLLFQEDTQGWYFAFGIAAGNWGSDFNFGFVSLAAGLRLAGTINFLDSGNGVDMTLEATGGVGTISLPEGGTGVVALEP